MHAIGSCRKRFHFGDSADGTGCVQFNKHCHLRYGLAVQNMPLEMAATAPDANVDPAVYLPPALRSPVWQLHARVALHFWLLLLFARSSHCNLVSSDVWQKQRAVLRSAPLLALTVAELRQVCTGRKQHAWRQLLMTCSCRAGLELLVGILNMAKPGSTGKMQAECWYVLTLGCVMMCRLSDCMQRVPPQEPCCAFESAYNAGAELSLFCWPSKSHHSES